MNPRYGKTFKQLRAEKGIPLAALEVPKSTLHAFENGQSMMAIDKLDFALQNMKVTLQEYEYFINDFAFDYPEEVFLDIEEAYYLKDLSALEKVYLTHQEDDYRLLALAAKAAGQGLTADEEEEVVDYLERVKHWGFYELSVFAYAVESLRVRFVLDYMKTFWSKTSHYKNIFKYRRRIQQAAHRAALMMIKRREQRAAKTILRNIEPLLYERDLFSKNMNQFVLGFYTFVFEDKGAGRERMLKAIEVFNFLGSHKLRDFYLSFYEEHCL